MHLGVLLWTTAPRSQKKPTDLEYSTRSVVDIRKMNNEDIQSNYFRANLYNGINLAFLDCAVDGDRKADPQKIILLLHGFPETSYEWRKVIPILTSHGYRIIAPDYRGAGESSKPKDGFSKTSMAADIVMLLDDKGIDEPVHVVGHDIGGIIAFTMASRWPDRVATLCIIECLLPGTNTFYSEREKTPNDYFYHTFHSIENLPEALILGREKTYIEYFVNKLCYRLGAFTFDVIQRYANAYSQPGALRSALDLYRAFDKDAVDLNDWMREHGKAVVPTLILSGEHSSYGGFLERMMQEVVVESSLRWEVVEEAAHFVPEENPIRFTEVLLGFLDESGED